MKISRLFNFACGTSLVCFFVMIIACIGMLVAEIIIKPDESFAGFTWIQPFAIILVTLFTVCVLILWIEGWWFVFKGWNQRMLSLNLAFVALLLVGPVFGAYIFHFLNSRQTGRKQ